MAVVFPVDVITPEDRAAYSRRGVFMLVRLHNGLGKWFTKGLTQAQWDTLPAKIRARYPFASRMTKVQWEDWLNDVYPRIEKPLLFQFEKALREMEGATKHTMDLAAIAEL